MMMYKMQFQRSIFMLIIGFFVFFNKYANAQGGNGLYSRRYEKIDVDTILGNSRLVTNYVDCLLNKRPCPPEGKDLKRILPEALRTKCGRCWPSQKEGALKVITKLYYDYPEHYAALREKWDPTGEYHRRFEEYLRDQNFNLISNDEDRDEQPIALPPAAAAATTTTTTTTTTSTTQRPQVPENTPTRFPNPLQTQRPTRQDAQETQESLFANRFGGEESEFDDMKRKEQPQRTPAPTARPPPKTTTARVICNTLPPGGSATVTIFRTQNPILNFINRLTHKFANTAEILAGMLRVRTTQVQPVMMNNMAGTD